MKRIKKALAIMCMFALVMGCTACAGGSDNAADKTVTEGNFTITLTEKFEKQSDAQGFDWMYMSDKVIVMGVSESQELLSQAGMDISTVEDYGKACVAAHEGIGDVAVQSAGNYAYAEYEQKIQSVDYSYYCAFYKGADSYWAVTFSTLKEDYAAQKDNIAKWAASAAVQ